MKKILFFLLLISTPVYAAQVCLDFPSGEQARILNGITHDGKMCQQGETLGACAKRIVAGLIKGEVVAWEDVKQKKAAVDALTPPSEPGIS